MLLVKLLRVDEENTFAEVAVLQILNISTAIRTSLLAESVLVLVMAIEIVFPSTADGAIRIRTWELVMLRALVLLQLTKIVNLISSSNRTTICR